MSDEHGALASSDRAEAPGSVPDLSVAAEAVAEPAEQPADAALLCRFDQLDAALASVRDELRAAHERAAARERIIDRLYDDNQRLRSGERQLLLRPLLVDLQQLRNELLHTSAGLREGLTTEQMAELLTSFAYSLELSLERGGVRVLRPADGEPFDPARHRATGTLPAESFDQDGTVAEVMSDGYLDTVTDRVVAPATVRVHRWNSPVPVGQAGAEAVPRQPRPPAD